MFALKVILKNITGMLGAMIGVAIILNVYNRVSNRRRRKKLRHSIFELPVYVYTASTRKRARAARLARLQAQGEEGELPIPHDDDPRLRKRLRADSPSRVVGALEEGFMVLPIWQTSDTIR